MGSDGVGYRKPPQHTRFTKGKSGNPKGRKQGSRNLKTDLFEELASKVIVKEGGKRRSLTKQQALLKRLVEQGFGGDYKAMALLFGLKAQYERAEGVSPEQTPSAEEDLRILARFFPDQYRKAPRNKG
jgi:hypothetical protein